MGCGESKHAVSTAEPVKKSSASRSSSRRMDNKLDRRDSRKTKTAAEAGSATPVEDEVEKPGGVVAPDATVVEKEVAVKTERVSSGVKEEEKKTVVVVPHEWTMSKGSPGTDYYSEDARSEYESPPHEVIIAAKEGGERKKDGSGVAGEKEKKMEGEKERKIGEELKMESKEGDRQEQMKTEGNAQKGKDQVAMANEEKEGESRNNAVAVAVVGAGSKDEAAAMAGAEEEKKKAIQEQVAVVAEENIKEAMRGITL